MTVAMSEWTEMIDDLTAYVRWRRETGARAEEFEPETAKAFLRSVSGVGCPVSGTRNPEPGAPRPATRHPQVPDPELRMPHSAPGTPEARRTELANIAAKLAACTRCELCRQRKQVVPGQGNPLSPDVMFVGEAPGADEDAQGLAFVGAAGQLLTKMIAAMGYAREEVFIANICKCRPPNNRPPAPDEMNACLPYLREQIAVVRPKVLVAMGATAVKALLESSRGISQLRGTWMTYAGIPLMPTFHPAYLLRLASAKHEAWSDLKKVLVRLGRPVPEKRKDA